MGLVGSETGREAGRERLCSAAMSAFLMALLMALLVTLPMALSGCDNDRPRPPRAMDFEFAEESASPVYLAEEPLVEGRREWPIRPAVSIDSDYDSSELVTVHRFVYRHRTRFQPILGAGLPSFAQAPKELRVDVSKDRIRVTFLGPDWPIPGGSEVRMQAGRPSVYVFDGEGGRSVGVGQLAAWYEGAPLQGSPGFGLRVDEEPGLQEYMPLFCRFLAEWGRASLDVFGRRCEAGAPRFFRIGRTQATLTAHVPMKIPRRYLRADHLDPPEGLLHDPGRVLVEEEILERLEPSMPDQREGDDEDEELPAELYIENRARGRSLIIIEGLQVAVLEEGASVTLRGLQRGRYRVGALRSFGARRSLQLMHRVPGELIIE